MALCTSRERRDALSLVGASARCSASLAVFFGLCNTALCSSVQAFSLCLLAACKTLASTMDAPHASFCAVWVGNWSPRIVLTYQLLSSLGSRERRRVAPTTAVATSAQSDLSKCFEETLGLARTLSEPLLRRPQNLRHKSKLVVVSR